MKQFHASIQVARSETVRLGVSLLRGGRVVGRDWVSCAATVSSVGESKASKFTYLPLRILEMIRLDGGGAHDTKGEPCVQLKWCRCLP